MKEDLPRRGGGAVHSPAASGGGGGGDAVEVGRRRPTLGSTAGFIPPLGGVVLLWTKLPFLFIVIFRNQKPKKSLKVADHFLRPSNRNVRKRQHYFVRKR